MRRVHRVGLVLGVAWVATACVAVLGLDDVTFTPHSTDASDAALEAAALDASVEAPSDAGTESSLPRSYWCDAQADALFCDDFDDLSFLPDGAVPRGWTELLSA
jgi:hypothetical protein